MAHLNELQERSRKLRRALRIAREALQYVADYPANGNSEPDVMADALGKIHARVRHALEASAHLLKRRKRKRV